MLADFVPDDVFIAPRLMEEVAEKLTFHCCGKRGAFRRTTCRCRRSANTGPRSCCRACIARCIGSCRGSTSRICGNLLVTCTISRKNKSETIAGERVWFTFPVPEWMGQDGETLASSKVIAALNDRRALERLVPEAARPCACPRGNGSRRGWSGSSETWTGGETSRGAGFFRRCAGPACAQSAPCGSRKKQTERRRSDRD